MNNNFNMHVNISVRTALGVVVGWHKQSVTQYGRRNDTVFGWQSRYHDHIIRGMRDGNKIAEHIENNETRWDADCFIVRAGNKCAFSGIRFCYIFLIMKKECSGPYLTDE